MSKSTTSSLFPDVNVWLALSYSRHRHSDLAHEWLTQVRQHESLSFCRFTQIALLRLLTNSAVMGADVYSQFGAWQVYDRWIEDGRVAFLDEPQSVQVLFRKYSSSIHPAQKDWADSYIAALADLSGSQLITFDRAMYAKYPNVTLLSA